MKNFPVNFRDYSRPIGLSTITYLTKYQYTSGIKTRHNRYIGHHHHSHFDTILCIHLYTEQWKV